MVLEFSTKKTFIDYENGETREKHLANYLNNPFPSKGETKPTNVAMLNKKRDSDIT